MVLIGLAPFFAAWLLAGAYRDGYFKWGQQTLQPITIVQSPRVTVIRHFVTVTERIIRTTPFVSTITKTIIKTTPSISTTTATREVLLPCEECFLSAAESIILLVVTAVMLVSALLYFCCNRHGTDEDEIGPEDRPEESAPSSPNDSDPSSSTDSDEFSGPKPDRDLSRTFYDPDNVKRSPRKQRDTPDVRPARRAPGILEDFVPPRRMNENITFSALDSEREAVKSGRQPSRASHGAGVSVPSSKKKPDGETPPISSQTEATTGNDQNSSTKSTAAQAQSVSSDIQSTAVDHGKPITNKQTSDQATSIANAPVSLVSAPASTNSHDTRSSQKDTPVIASGSKTQTTSHDTRSGIKDMPVIASGSKTQTNSHDTRSSTKDMPVIASGSKTQGQSSSDYGQSEQDINGDRRHSSFHSAYGKPLTNDDGRNSNGPTGSLEKGRVNSLPAIQRAVPQPTAVKHDRRIPEGYDGHLYELYLPEELSQAEFDHRIALWSAIKESERDQAKEKEAVSGSASSSKHPTAQGGSAVSSENNQTKTLTPEEEEAAEDARLRAQRVKWQKESFHYPSMVPPKRQPVADSGPRRRTRTPEEQAEYEARRVRTAALRAASQAGSAERGAESKSAETESRTMDANADSKVQDDERPRTKEKEQQSKGRE